MSPLTIRALCLSFLAVGMLRFCCPTLPAADGAGNPIEEAAAGSGGDCNGNGIPDEQDLHPPPIFEAATEVPRGLGSFSVTAGDLDGDGDLDLASADFWYDRISLLFNDGEAGFIEGPPITSGTAPEPWCIANADLDGDGDLDLALVRAGVFDASLYLNRGDGMFVPGAELPLSNDVALSVAARDIEDDGDIDLAFAVVNSGIGIFTNKGSGEFSRVQMLAAGPAPESMAFEDLDGDGDLDLAAAYYGDSANGGISILLNGGGGAFGPAVLYHTGGLSVSIAAGDFDGDGDIDLSTNTWIFTNAGDGTFSAPPVPLGVPGYSLAAADLDGDGDPDLAVGEVSDRSFRILLDEGGKFEVQAEFPAGGHCVLPADLDRDGRIDLAVSNADDVIVLLNRPAVPPSPDANRNGVPDECERFHRADPNGDGASDIADAIAILEFLFLDGQAPPCRESADVDDDGAIDIADAVFLLDFLFLGGPAPPAPGPASAPCGIDPEGSPDNLGCETYGSCS